jgi:RNA polymerase sigma factor (sigma-70 family)
VFNPFTEVVVDDEADAELVDLAKSGDRVALEKLVRRHQAWIFNIAIRMVFQPQDAEEVTQEVLIKVITKLGTFKGESKFRTWLYRIAANHVLNMKRRSAETKVTFADYGAAIDNTPDLDCLIRTPFLSRCLFSSKKPRMAARWECCFAWTASSV